MAGKALLHPARVVTRTYISTAINQSSSQHSTSSWGLGPYAAGPQNFYRCLHDGLESNPLRRAPAQSRGRLISRLDRILTSPSANHALSTSQLAHIQYLRDFWAHRDVSQTPSDRDLQRINTMAHETTEVLRRYSAQVDHGSTVTAIPTAIPMARDSDHRQQLKKVKRVFGERGRLVAKQAMPFKSLILLWAVAAVFGVPILWLFERGLMKLFPERAKRLEEEERRKYQEAHELFYGDAAAKSHGRRPRE